MLMRITAILLASFSVTRAAPAQQTPYADRTALPIKALTPEQIAGYLDGDGMGFALAAELNGYPGPRHVLELADSLGLTKDRRVAIQVIFDEMNAKARQLGAGIVRLEAGLDSAFAEHRITQLELNGRLTEVAGLRGQLRFVHLDAHLAVTAMLSLDEVRAYQRLRGYGVPHDPRHHEGMEPASADRESP